MMRTVGLFIFSSLLSVAFPVLARPLLPIVGHYEYATAVEAPGVIMDALVDTGAQTTSADARHIRTHMSRSGQRWVYFTLTTAETTADLHLPIVRIARVLSHSKVTIRPVVQLTLIVGDIASLTEVSLIDRSNFPNPLLIGRNFLKGKALVDVSGEYLMEAKP